MPPLPVPDGANRAVLRSVAKLHYETGLSQVEIARQMGVSTATVSRLLQRARAEGIVRIEIADLVNAGELADALKSRLGLRLASVIDAPAGTALPALAGPVGDMLQKAQLGAGSVLAIGWGRAVRAIVDAGLPSLPGVLAVPATGGMQQHAPHFQINEFVRLAALRMEGVPYFIHAPYLPSAGAREALVADPAIAATLALWDRIDAAIFGVGLPHAMNSPEASAATPSEQALVNAVGDVIRHYFDADGRLIDWEGEGRMIAASPGQLRRIPLSIGAAVGPEKARAILGAIRAGFINALATDTRTAEAILELV